MTPPRRPTRTALDRITGALSGLVSFRQSDWVLFDFAPRSGEAKFKDIPRKPKILVRDLVSGAISAVVTISYSLSFAALIFSGEHLAPHLDAGIRMALMSAGVTVILAAMSSPFYFAIAGPDSRSAAVQSALAGNLAAALATLSQRDPSLRIDALPHILFALSVSTAVTGIALYVLGRLKMGRWIRYVPYPVVGGFLVSTGWVLAVGGVRVMTDVKLSLATLPRFAEPAVALHLVLGVVFAATMFVVLGRAKHYLTLPGLLVAGTLATHLALFVSGLNIRQGQEQGWLLRVSGAGKLWMPLRDVDLHGLHWHEVLNHSVEAIVLISVTAIAVLVTAAAIEVATKRDADLDKELKGHGIANVASGLLGGIVGSNAIARSMLNLQAGAMTRLSGVFAGSICLLILFISPKLAGYLARPVMGATLLYLGLRLLQEWVIKAYRKLTRTDYFLVMLMLVMVIYSDKFVVGLFVGALASCLIFAVNYSRVSLVKNAFTCDEYGSKVQRSAEENQVLRLRGRQFWVLRLRGYLFFGSIVGLVSDVQRRIKQSHARDIQALRVLVLDFRYTNGMDSSAALSLVKLRQIIEERRMQLVLTALEPDVERTLRREHCIRDDEVVKVFDDLDAALEWCELRAIAMEPSLSRNDLPFVQRLGKEFGSSELAQRFLSYVERIELKDGEYLFRQGDASGAIYVVESGRVRIELERSDGPPLLLRSVTSNTTLGEMGLYRSSIRSASVVADAKSVIHRLTRAALDTMEINEPKVASAFHTYVIRTLADRLHVADKAISALER